MIIGIGLDTVEIARVKKACRRERFLEDIFTEEERKQFDNNGTRMASDFAGKEAVVKVLGTGFRGIRPCEVEILRNKSGAPYVNLYRKAKETADNLGIVNIHISITNTASIATAFAIGIGAEPQTNGEKNPEDENIVLSKNRDNVSGEEQAEENVTQGDGEWSFY